jgi:hypothetical protein
MKYIFKQIDDISGHKSETTLEFSADYLPDILEHFEMFLRGSGFHASGVLDFVNEDDCEEWHNEEFDTPQEETHEWTQTLRDDAEWPFPKSSVTENWQGVAPSVAMQWTVDQLMNKPIVQNCSVCGISLETMKNQKCWDKFCPKGNDAN